VEADGADEESRDAAGGELAYYLVRAENACPDGRGSLGVDSRGDQRAGRDCP
jgi:hypothetical protein